MRYKGVKTSYRQSGFTIIELLIATLVFSVILLIATYGVIQISKTFIKGYISSETQNTTRSVMDQLSQAIELSGPDGVTLAAANPPYNAFCVDGYTYTYEIGVELTSLNQVFVRSKTGGAACLANASGLNGTELLSVNERLVNLSVISLPDPGLFQINLSVLYGNTDVTVGGNGITCSTIDEGGDFCGLATTSTTVEQRS